jgi:hypothetical protein
VKIQDVRKVTINERWWRTTTHESEKRQLIYHELGHCILNLEHDLRYNKLYNQPESIMYPQMMSFLVFEPYESKYLDQLFGLVVSPFSLKATYEKFRFTSDGINCEHN